MLRLKFAARSDVGMIRSGNEDSYDADYNANRGVFVVADGMGGHAAGEVASLMAVEAVMKELSDLKEIDETGTAGMHADDVLVFRPRGHHRVDILRFEGLVERDRGILRRREDRRRAGFAHRDDEGGGQGEGRAERARL